MRIQLLRLACWTILFCTTAPYLSAETRILDLSTPSPGFDTPISVSKGPLLVQIINKVPTATYRVAWEIDMRIPPPLPIAPFQDAARIPAECVEVRVSLERLIAATTEQEVSTEVPKVRGAILSALANGCARDQSILLEANKTLAATTEKIEVDLPYDSELRVDVVRFDAQAELKTWQVAYRAPDGGQWLTSYGFTFLPNHDELFFSKSVDETAGTFKITRKSNNRKEDFSPAIFYAWFPEKLRGGYGSWSLAGGLGFDLSNLVVFLGPAFTVGHNLTIVAGVAMHKEKRLNGQLSPNAVISENLSEAQLHEETYKPTWFAGLSFRFDSAPATHKNPPSPPATSGEK